MTKKPHTHKNIVLVDSLCFCSEPRTTEQMQKGFVILLFQSTDDFLFRVKACLDVLGKIGKLNEGLF